MKSFIQVTSEEGTPTLLDVGAIDSVQGTIIWVGEPLHVRETYEEIVKLIAAVAKVEPSPETRPPLPPCAVLSLVDAAHPPYPTASTGRLPPRSLSGRGHSASFLG